MEKAAPNPIRTRLEELTQALAAELRSIPAHGERPASATRQTARLLLEGLSTVLETADGQYFIRAVERWLQATAESPGGALSAEDYQRSLDQLEDRVMPVCEDAADLRLMWGTVRQARALAPAQPTCLAGFSADARLFELVMDHLPQKAFWKDRSGRYLGCNLAFAQDAGRGSVQEMLGKTDDDMPWKDYAEKYRSDDFAVIDSGQPQINFVEEHVGADGELQWVEVSKIPMRNPEGEVFAVLGMFEDITERKRLERQLERSLAQRGHQVQVSTQVAQEIASAPDLSELFERVVTLVKEQFGYYHTQLLRYEPAQDAVVLMAGYGEVGRRQQALSHRMPLGEGLIGVAAATGQTVMRPVLAEDPDWRPNPLLPATRGEIAVPIKFRGEVLGVLDVQSDQANALTEDDRLLLEGLCGEIAMAIEDTRLRREMEEQLQELDALYQATSHEAWQAFRQRERQASGYIYDQVSVRAIAPASSREPQAAASANGHSKELLPRFDAGALDPAVSAAITPLTVRGEVVGKLGVYEDPSRPLSSEERQLIEQVSEEVAQALESARLFEQTQLALSESHALFEGSSRVLRASSVQEILEVLVKVGPLAVLDRASLTFFDRAWDRQAPSEMVIAADWVKDAPQQGRRVGARLPFAWFTDWVEEMDLQHPEVIEDAATDPRFGPQRLAQLEADGMHGIALWPLRAGSEVYGVLSAQSQRPLRLSADDLRLVSSLVDQAAIVIRSLTLQQDMSGRLEELASLQRLMSREAWAAYQSHTQPGQEALGYLFDQVNLYPVTKEMLPQYTLSGGPNDRGSWDVPGGLVKVQESSGSAAYSAALEVSGEPIGTLGVRVSPGRTLSLEEETFLQAVSEQVSQAMERARLVEQTQKSAVELQAVAEVGTATATILDPDLLLQQVADLTQQRFGLYHTNIYLLDEAGAHLVLSAASGKVGRSLVAEGWSIPLDEPESVVAKAARTRAIQLIDDVRQERGYLPNPSLPDTRTELALPLMLADRLLGVFDVQANVISRFSSEDLRIYNTLAAQMTVALQNAKLYAEQLATLERMRELDNMKSAFLANMSHELRTPLNSILGFTQVILEGLDGPTTDIMSADLELIEKNGNHLLHLINEILDMSKIESGRLSLSPEALDLRELLEDVIETNRMLARARSLNINLRGDPAGDWVVMADQVRMRQIFINLIGNSIKFTEKGGLTIDLERFSQPTGEEVETELVRIRFTDTGIGIPVQKLEEIFEAFTQVDNSTTRKVGGTGLGLPISRRLVEMHGGKLWAESHGQGTGSTFVLELPVGALL